MKKELIVGKHVLSSTNVLFSSIPYQQFIYSCFLKKFLVISWLAFSYSFTKNLEQGQVFLDFFFFLSF